jgi:predicted amidohydrolase YtcJ
MQAYLAAREAGKLLLRVNMNVISAFLDEVLDLGLGRMGDDHLSFIGIKLYADGAFGAATAYFPEGYASDPHNHGLLYHEPDEFAMLVRKAHRAGLKTATHAQSPAAIGMVIDAIEAAQNDQPRPDMRHSIEHCGLPTDEEIARMKRASIVPDTQPQHHRQFADGMARIIGDQLAHHFNPIGLYAKAGLPVVLSCDAPVAFPKPLEAVQAAVDRTTVEGTVLGGPELKIDVLTALKGYTIAGAYLAGREDSVGSLEAGKLADLVVLSKDPLAVSVAELSSIEVEQVWLAGQVAAIRSRDLAKSP